MGRPVTQIDISWMRDAICTTDDHDLFFPEGRTGCYGVDFAPAIVICRGCPVRRQCLDFALANNIEHGVWGGAEPGERRRLRKQRAS